MSVGAIKHVSTVFSGLLGMARFNLTLVSAFIAVLLITGLCVLLIWQNRVIVSQQEELRNTHSILQNINRTAKLEDNLNVLLGVAQGILQAPYYAFYTRDARSGHFALRTVTHPFDDFEGIGPAYSGLALPKKETYLPPLTLDPPAASQSVSLVKIGEVPLVLLLFSSKQALVRLGPVRALTRAARRSLQRFVAHVDGIVEDLVLLDHERERAEIASVAERSIQQIACMATDVSAALTLILQAFAGSNGSAGGFLIDTDEASRHTVCGTESVGMLGARLQEDAAAVATLSELLAERAHRLVTRADAEFYSLPDYMLERGSDAVVLVGIRPRGLLVILYGNTFNPQVFLDAGAVQVKLLADQLSHIRIQQASRHRLIKVYSGMLWKMADMVDNLQPYSVGYSEMMTRYALAIGHELSLTPEEMVDLSLAAHLSNIGTLGLSIDLVAKEGKFSDFEFETMKLHSEIGASMIQIATGNKRAAAYVLYHHERMDGRGYPAGLRGADIPAGARILHVVQFFLAKINGRPWRPALPFDQALAALQNAAGKQLDPAVVQALVNWFGRLGQNPAVRGYSLARCFEMCCTPRAICESCPAFRNTAQNCWEVGDVRCQSHGRECATCFVRTEYLSRTRSL